LWFFAPLKGLFIMAEVIRKSVGLSLGTTSISMAVIHQRHGDQPEIMAFDRVPCRFLRDGMIVNLEALQDAISSCRNNIACLVKTSFCDTSVNLCGVPLRTETGTLTLELKKKTEIKKKHLSDTLLSRPFIEDESWRLIYHHPGEYDLDNQTKLASPIGLAGKTLSVHIQQIFAPATTVDNILHSINRCGFRISHIVTDPLSSFESLVTDDEREMGIWLLDMGGRVMQTAYLFGRDTFIIPPIQLGGDTVTSDIAIGLNTTFKDAERIKIEHGCALPELASDDVKVHIPPLGGGRSSNPTSQHRLAEIIKSRMEELLEMAAGVMADYAADTGYVSPGIILTGGGSMLPGTLELATKHLGMPVIKGHLRNVTGLTDIAPVPLCASAIGLALYGLRNKPEIVWNRSGRSPCKRIMKHVVRWLGGIE
jgi:cell division protein FtsA